ncbi:MAG: mechanosensitive ion channel domain-containing protein [Hyphomicrobiales bacterium]
MCHLTFLARALAIAMVFVALFADRAVSSAEVQPAAVGQPQKIEDLLKLLGDPEVRKWVAAQKEAVPARAADQGNALSFMGLADRIRLHLSDLAAAVPALPGEIEAAGSKVSRELMGRGAPWMALLFVLFLGAGFAVQRLFWRLARFWREWIAGARLDTVRERLIAMAARFLFNAGLVLAFALGSIGAFFLFEWPPLTREILLGYLLAAVMFWLGRAVLDFLLSPFHSSLFGDAERFRIVPMPNEAAIFWARRLNYAAAWFAFGWITIRLLLALGVSHASTQLIAYALGSILLAMGIEAVWRRPAATLSTEHHRLGYRARSWLWSILFVALWLAWVAGAMKLFWLVAVTAGLPWAVLIAERAIHNVLRPPGTEQGKVPVPRVLAAAIERGLRAALIVAAVLVLAWAWEVDLTAMAAQDDWWTRAVRGAFMAVFILLLADFLWQICRTIIDKKLIEASGPEETIGEEAQRRARIKTLLPIVRNVLVITVAVVAALMALSSLGVEIGPLIAGAGVVGVAIGFGAQTVVKDIISGFFYLLDDAFRVGEYIESGGFKGTVESFSLRSVKLRHHRGALYTIPFSLLGTVQNQSRDWVIEKITVTVTYDSDVEKARKIVKKIGLDLAEDPEFKASTIEPLKMQGIDNFGDSGIVLRMKLKTRPGEQFGIKRRALMMIKQAFEENGIKMAFPTVQIAGAGDGKANAFPTVRITGDDALAAAAQRALTLQKNAGPA